MAAPTIPNHYPTEFALNWESKVQRIGQEWSRWATMDPSFTGKEKFYNQINSVTHSLNTGRIQATNLEEIESTKYWLRTAAYQLATGFDEWDDALLGDIVLPTSETMAEHTKSWSRTVTDVLLTALTGTRYIGENGATTDALPSGQKIVYNFSGSAEGLTFGKVVEAYRICGENNVAFREVGRPTFMIRTKQITDLYLNVAELRGGTSSTEVALEPFSRDTMLSTGEMSWMGINFVREEGVTVNSSDYALCPFFFKPSLKYTQNDLSAKMSVRDDLNEALQIRTKGRIGGVRTQNELVVEVACDESP